MHPFLLAFIGGTMIGLSATLMLLFKGRVTGISGILNGFLTFDKGNFIWRGYFLLGLVCGGLILSLQAPETLVNSLEQPLYMTGIGGFLVGFGTLLGNGCTSGHGVCGISRLSPRSIVATLVFISFGIISVYLIQHVLEMRS